MFFSRKSIVQSFFGKEIQPKRLVCWFGTLDFSLVFWFSPFSPTLCTSFQKSKVSCVPGLFSIGFEKFGFLESFTSQIKTKWKNFASPRLRYPPIHRGTRVLQTLQVETGWRNESVRDKKMLNSRPVPTLFRQNEGHGLNWFLHSSKGILKYKNNLMLLFRQNCCVNFCKN